MESFVRVAPIIAIVLPLIGAFLTPLVGMVAKRYGVMRLVNYFTLAIILSTLITVVSMTPTIWGGTNLGYELGGRAAPYGIALAVDGLNILIALIVAGASALVVVYSFIFMREDSGLSKYYTLILLVTAGMMGVTLTGDIFNLYVFFEVMCIASYALVAFRRNREAIEASLKYMIISTLGTSFMLMGIALLYGALGTLNIADIAGKLALVGPAPPILIVALAMLITGFGIKIAMVPLHAWMPDAYQAAPTPVSVLLAGGTAAVGVYAILRVGYIMFGPLDPTMAIGWIFVGLGLVTMVLGAVMALVQRDLKRLLAYSGISQMGYVLLGVGLGTALGIQGALFHMLNNVIYKMLLFMVAGILIYRIGTSDMNRLGGLASNMPITAAAFAIGALAIAGVPPFNGFVSKWTIYVAGIEAGYAIFTVIALVISALTLAYFFKAFSMIFLGQRPRRLKNVQEAPVAMLFPVIILAVLCVLFGILPQLGINLVGPAVGVFGVV